MNFICDSCKTGADLKNDDFLVTQAKKFWHKKCKGGTWCDCQHRVRG